MYPLEIFSLSEVDSERIFLLLTELDGTGQLKGPRAVPFGKPFSTNSGHDGFYVSHRLITLEAISRLFFQY